MSNDKDKEIANQRPLEQPGILIQSPAISSSSNNYRGTVPSEMPRLNPIPPTVSASNTAIVSYLMCFCRKHVDTEFAKKAIESLLKRVRGNREQIDALLRAVGSFGADAAGCVTVPRTNDGRLQIGNRKCFPHAVYAKIWRWHDVQKNDLRHLPICKYSFFMALDPVCVNPYHYERREIRFPPVDLSFLRLNGLTIPKSSNATTTSSLTIQSGEDSESAQQMNNDTNETARCTEPLPIQPPKFPFNSRAKCDSCYDEDYVKEPRPAVSDDAWGTIAYWKLDRKLGEMKALKTEFTIDGCGEIDHMGTEPAVTQEDVREAFRNRYMKNGITISYKDTGDIWIHNNTYSPVYVSSPYLDKMAGRTTADVVHVVHSSSKLKVLDVETNFRLIEQHVYMSGLKTDSEEPKADNFREAIERFSVVTLSFFDNWAEGNRCITDCKCWIEIKSKKTLERFKAMKAEEVAATVD